MRHVKEVKTVAIVKAPVTRNASVCEKCRAKREFKTERHLLRHVETVHNKIKKFSCDPCPSRTRIDDYHYFGSLNVKADLTRHVRNVHDKDKRKRFTCPHCQVGLRNKSTVERHIANRHNGPKKFVCDGTKCDKAFTDKWSLARHVFTLHV